jgi:ATP-dependent helicase/nuclease subunit A
MVSASDVLRQLGPAEGLCVVGASAGSGKTHHLTQVVVQALEGRAAFALDVESLVAVTFTTRAATELRSRIRQTLVGQGASETALRLPLARLGTVHAVCLSWLQDFAIDAGLPPGVQVLPEDGGLHGRWIRYLPRPLCNQSKNLGFVEREEQSPQGLEAREDERRERTRLLYVGFTRARDHLILAARRRNDQLQTAWLDELCGSDGEPLLRLPIVASDEGDTVGVAGTQVRAGVRVWEIDPEHAVSAPQNDTAQVLTWRRPDVRTAREAFLITPSNAGDSWQGLPQLQVQEIVRVGSPLSVQRAGPVDWAAFGTTVHAFLAADRRQDVPAARLERAGRLARACVSGATLEPEALIAMGDALYGFVDERWPGALWHREVPVRVRAGSDLRRVNGTIDLLLETDEGYVVVDHKTFGDPREVAIRAAAEKYLPQLAAYGEAIGVLGAKRVKEYWLQLGVVGVWVRCGKCREAWLRCR